MGGGHQHSSIPAYFSQSITDPFEANFEIISYLGRALQRPFRRLKCRGDQCRRCTPAIIGLLTPLQAAQGGSRAVQAVQGSSGAVQAVQHYSLYLKIAAAPADRPRQGADGTGLKVGGEGRKAL